jgi:hypothetical protein
VLVHLGPLRAPKVEMLRKKERHEDIEEGRALLERSINQVDD